MTNQTPPSNAVAFVQQNGFWCWQLSNGRYRSCYDWGEWLAVFGGEWELDTAVDMGHEPDDSEFAELMKWRRP